MYKFILSSFINSMLLLWYFFFFFQAEDGIRDIGVTGVQTCALPIWSLRYLAPTNMMRNVIAAPMNRNQTPLFKEMSIGPRCKGTTHSCWALSQVWRIWCRISSWVNCCISAKFPITILSSVLLHCAPIPRPGLRARHASTLRDPYGGSHVLEIGRAHV